MTDEAHDLTLNEGDIIAILPENGEVGTPIDNSYWFGVFKGAGYYGEGEEEQVRHHTPHHLPSSFFWKLLVRVTWFYNRAEAEKVITDARNGKLKRAALRKVRTALLLRCLY